MTKIINIQNNISKLNFEPADERYEQYYAAFLSSDLGIIYKAIPWNELVKVISAELPKKKRQGQKGFFTLAGKLGLMFLKNYLNCSDSMLTDRLNSDYMLQFFCGVYIRPEQQIKDKKLISQIRCELSKVLILDKCQKVLAQAWSPYMKNKSVCLTDATCFESKMRFPSRVKLAWECCEWVHQQMRKMCKLSKQKMPRSKYEEQHTKYLHYQKTRKKTYKKELVRMRSLLYLLDKLLNQIIVIEQACEGQGITMTNQYKHRINTIHKILEQQEHHFDTNEPIKDRIVSISKDYIRPIVRGKENKSVEFGAKANCVQIDGINFIEHISFDAFNEGVRLIQSIDLVRQLSGNCTHISADRIYATNKNRKYCTKNNIVTNFDRKGKPGPNEKQRIQMQSILNKERSTRLEGSFGNEKQNYGLAKNPTKTKSNEILYIFFGIHLSNAVHIGRRIANMEKFKKSA
jgi:hypothetical protein